MSRPRSVSDMAAMFENRSNNTKSPIKSSQKVKARKHSKSTFFENVFKTQQAELIQGPRKELTESFDAINDKKKQIESVKFNPGKVAWNPPAQQTVSNPRSVGKLDLDARFTHTDPTKDTPQKAPAISNKIALDNNFAEQLSSCLRGESKKDPEHAEQEQKDNNVNADKQMMTDAPDQAEAPQMRGLDRTFNQDGYFTISGDGKTAQFAKKKNYQYYPACRVSRPIDASDVKSQTVKFKLYEYGWYGVGSDNVTPHGFPGYTDSGWMVRVSNGGSWYADIANAVGSNATGNLTNVVVTMNYNPNTKQLIVTKPDGTQYTYTHEKMPGSGRAYFVFTMASGKVELIE